jgi:rare lipoprotein A
MAPGASRRFRSLALLALFGVLLSGCASAPGGGSFRATSYGTGVGIYTVGSPYEIRGRWYYPAVDYNYDRTGIASWYGADFDGKYTANGEIYDMNRLTAAHTTLPLPSIVQVVNLQNGRSLQLRVNDRGPFLDGRLIDVSRRSAQLLGFETQGTAPVRVRIMKAASIAAAEAAMRDSGQILVAQAVDVAPALVAPAGAAPMPSAKLPPRIAYRAAAPTIPIPAAAKPPPAAAPEPEIVAGAVAQMRPSSAKIYAELAGSTGRIYIQAGAFAMRDNAQRVQSRIARLGSVLVTTASINGVALYRVRLGPVESAAQANRLLALVVGSGYPAARIVGD